MGHGRSRRLWTTKDGTQSFTSLSRRCAICKVARRRGRELRSQYPLPQRTVGVVAHPATVQFVPCLSRGHPHRVDAPNRRVFTVTPYVLGDVSRDYTRDSEATMDGTIGGEAKLGLTQSLALDLTVNTDFAQVEVDDAQVNLTRFPFSFPRSARFFWRMQARFQWVPRRPPSCFSVDASACPEANPSDPGRGPADRQDGGNAGRLFGDPGQPSRCVRRRAR